MRPSTFLGLAAVAWWAAFATRDHTGLELGVALLASLAWFLAGHRQVNALARPARRRYR